MSARETLKEGFFQECEDLLETMSDGLSEMERGENDAEVVNAVFRAVHSIKGGAGAFGLNVLVNFAHSFENLLDDLRRGAVRPESSVIQLLFRASDRLFDVVEAERSGRDPLGRAQDAEEYDALLAQLATACAASPAADSEQSDPEADFVPTTLAFGPDLGLSDVEAALHTHIIRFAPHKSLYASGNDPVALFSALSDLGGLSVSADISAVPPLGALDWEESHIVWTLSLATELPVPDIMDVFEFVSSDAAISFEDLPAAVAEDMPTAPLETEEPPPAQVLQVSEARTSDPGKSNPSGSSNARQSIRVDLERVDRLINLVGELVISEAMLTQSITQDGLVQNTDIETALARLKQLSTELQERIMAIRAQSVKALFQRMSRIVREAAHATDREVRLITEGESTEVDKTVIEKLADPLTHILRNAVDHGIESAEARQAAGKPAHGTVRLLAAHRSGQVIIEIEDDGAGIDSDRVLAKAIERGLVSADAELSEQEIFHLLFEAGFSTAEQVSSLSGRGVGMDVVRSEIQALGGRVNIASVRGAGTTLTISLPLTLAVVEGMLVEVAGETLVIPSTALRETMRAEGAMVHRLGAGEPVLAIRGALIPIIDLGESLGFRQMPASVSGLPLLLVESAAGRLVALTADKIIHQREVVIKGLAENYGHVRGIAAATILGNGRIALIIDIDQVAGNGLGGQDEAASLTAHGVG
ncbi:MAG: chemotaxis protein CheA [Rhodobacteraceae bacterium]|nr:chemotaxis protein CheA [Paracoccaceae bacterium]